MSPTSSGTKPSISSCAATGVGIESANSAGQPARGEFVSLLFLDFDGVCHPVGCPVDQLFCHLDMLQDWLRRRPGVDVVISSSWRAVHPLDEMVSYFAEDLQGRVLGATPLHHHAGLAAADVALTAPVHKRHFEVLAWLAGSADPRRRWTALDDQNMLFAPRCENLVVVDGQLGLTVNDMVRLDIALRILARS